MRTIINNLENIDQDVKQSSGAIKHPVLYPNQHYRPKSIIDFTTQSPEGEEIGKLLKKLDKIEQKSKRPIVKLLDNTANFIEKTSKKIVNSIRNFTVKL